MKSLIPLLVIIILVSSCRKYRIEHSGCKEDAFIEEGFFLPNIFTPNGDGCNDFLRFNHDTAIVVSNFSIKVKNVFDIKVFESTDPNFEWDGFNDMHYGGKKCKLDMYKYEMSFDARNKNYHIKKTIVLDYMGDRNIRPFDACPAQFDNCAFGAQWDGTQFNPALPTNEFFTCD